MKNNLSRIFLKMLKDGKSVFDFLHLGEQFLNQPILYASRDFQTIVSSCLSPSQPLQDDIQNIRDHTTAISSHMEKVGGESPFLLAVSTVQKQFLFCPAVWNNHRIGLLIFSEFSGTLDQIDTDFIMELAECCALSSMFEPTIQIPKSKKLMVSVLRDLADGRLDDVIVFEKQMKNLGASRYCPYFVVSMFSAEYEKDSILLASIQDQLVKREDIDWILTESDHFLILCEGSEIPDSLQSFMHDMHDQYGFVYGVSDCSQDLWELKWRIEQAEKTVHLAVIASRLDVIFHFDDFKFYAVADLVDEEHWEGYLSNSFKSIMAYDIKNGTEYLRTIQSYITNDTHIQNTSDELFLHKNTLFYRLKRIKELFGLDLESNKDLLKIYFSFAVYKLKKNHAKESESSSPVGTIKL